MIKAKENNKVVYIHKYPGTNTVYYVGLGVESRPYDFVRRSKFWLSTYEKYGVEVEIVATDLTFEQACLIEQTLINLYGRRDIGTGSLVNHTDGGEGANGNVMSQEARNKISAAFKGRKLSDSHRAAMSESRKRRDNTVYREFDYRLNAASVGSKQKVKMPSKKLIDIILKLYVKNSRVSGSRPLARRFNLSHKTVTLIVKYYKP